MKNSLIRFLILFILAVTSVFGYIASAQNKAIDSLLVLLKKDKKDTNKVSHLYNLCREYVNTGSYDSAFYYGNSELKLSQELNFENGIANALGNMQYVYRLQGNYPKAL